MAKTPEQISAQVDESVEQYTERSLPRIGALKLNIQRKFMSTMNSVGRFFLNSGNWGYNHKLKKLESKEDKAQRKYDKLHSHVNRHANKTKNPKIKARRLNSPRLKQAEENLAYRKSLTKDHIDARNERIQSVEAQEAERRTTIDNNRQDLIKQKEVALAKKASRHLKKDFRRNGYSRAEAKILIEDMTPEQKKEMGKLSLRMVALNASSRRNELDLSIAEDRSTGLTKAIESTKTELASRKTELADINNSILNEMGKRVKTWDDVEVDRLIKRLKSTGSSLDLVKVSRLRQLREDFYDINSDVRELGRLKTAQGKDLVTAKATHAEIEAEYTQKKAILDRKLAKTAARLGRLKQEVENG